MVGKASKSAGFLVLLLLICAIIGSFIGDLLQPYIPQFLAKSFSIGTGPFPVNLKILSITFGITISMNFFSILGLITALIIYKRY